MRRNSRSPTFALVFRNWWTSIGIGVVAGCAIHFLIDPVVIPLAEKLTGSAMDLSQFADVQGNAGEFMTLLIVALVFGGIIAENKGAMAIPEADRWRKRLMQWAELL